MRDYIQITMDCELQGYMPAVASRIAHMCEFEDLWQEFLVTKIWEDKEAYSRAADLLWIRSMQIAAEEEINWVELLIVGGEAAGIESEELMLNKNGFDRKPNMLLASFLMFYCGLDSDQIFVIASLAGGGNDYQPS
jgi:hypothetical protein